MLNVLEKNGDSFAAALGPDERTGLGGHLRRHDVLYLTRSGLTVVFRSVVLHAETNNIHHSYFFH